MGKPLKDTSWHKLLVPVALLACMGHNSHAWRLSLRKRKPAAAAAKAEPIPAPNPAADTPEVRDAFRLGVKQFKDKQFDLASATLTQVPDLGGYLSLYKHWFLGQSLLELGKYKEAEAEIAKITQSSPSSEMKFQAQFLWGESALRQKKYPETVARLTPLEQKWRHSYRLPEVEFRLMTAEFKQGHLASACRRARTLYAKYPANSLVIGWGSALDAVEVDGTKLGCTAEKPDFTERVRNLQWAGESDKAHGEITARMDKAKDEDKRDLDMTLAAFLVNEGSVDDALNLLVRYYPNEKSNVAYLTLLGRAAARSGEYQTAVGALERAFEISPSSKAGREALYQAASLSYQFQDYDGAVAKFRQFAKLNPKSGLAKDAEWHLAWLQYLRGDFKGALEKFQAVADKARRARRKNDTLQERLLYWMAMAHVRLNEWSDARTLLEKIIANNAYSYYGLAAQARLENVVAQLGDNGKRQPADVPKPASPPPAAAIAAISAPGTVAAAAPANAAPSTPAADEERESEEDIADDQERTPAPRASDDDGAGEDEGMKPSDFKDPALRARIDVANKLIQLDLPELAKWELWEVEKCTRNAQYLRQLITAYEGIGSFNRSAVIADQNFGREREAGGLDGAKALWNSAYPQAYKSWVQQYAKQFTVPGEWVWSIMRTESMYRPDVISPVGAKGLMQLMQYTARNLAKLAKQNPDTIDLLNPEQNIQLGAQYLARLQTKFKGQLPLVAAAYNAGPHRVEGWLVNFGQLETDEFVEHIPFLETRNYVKKVVRYHTFYRRLYEKDQRSVGFLAKALGVPIPSRASTRESWESL